MASSWELGVWVWPLLVLVLHAEAGAETLRAAVAANFLAPLKKIAGAFAEDTGHRVEIISGSTGKLFTQVVHGAPFDVFLAADARRPRLLENNHGGVPGTRFTYALGRLVLWSPDRALVRGEGAIVLKQGRFNHLAMANPKTAPYGAAALQVMRQLGVWESIRSRVVQGENIGQTFHFVASENAELGFVALSQIMHPRYKGKGSWWHVPDLLHDPIAQDVVLLRHGKSNPAARALIDYLKGSRARGIIRQFGYGLK